MGGALERYRQEPIPSSSKRLLHKEHYRSWPIQNDHPLQSEKLVDCGTAGVPGCNFYNLENNPPYNTKIPGSIPELFVRESVLAKLEKIHVQLESEGLELYMYDAWRPATLQYYMHTVWAPEYIHSQNPNWTIEHIKKEVNQFWAVGPERESDIDPNSPPPHSTGGAVDITIRSKKGEPLWMGTSFDELTPKAFTSAFEEEDETVSEHNDEARKNRRLVYWLMHEEGFQNNPTEWWHFSYGDQMWAKLTSGETGNMVPAYYSNIQPE